MRRSIGAPWWASDSALAENDQGRGAVGEELALFGAQISLGGGDLAAAAQHPALAANDSLGRNRPNHVRLGLDGGVADARIKLGVDRAAGGAVDQGKSETAVDAPQRIEEMRPRTTLEHRAAGLRLDQKHSERLADRRRRKLARDHRAKE